MKKAIYAGSFDPITKGHLDIIKRSSGVFDKIYVVIMENPKKDYFFSVKERIKLIEGALVGISDKVVIEVHEGLMADYCKNKDIYTLIRGIRVVTDFDYEFQMATINRNLNEKIESVLFVASTEYSYVSSSMVKEIAYFGGDISGIVPPNVEEALKNKYSELS